MHEFVPYLSGLSSRGHENVFSSSIADPADLSDRSISDLGFVTRSEIRRHFEMNFID